MEEIINEEYASSIGFEYFDVHDTWFVMAGSGSPSIKGEINDGMASNVRVYFDTIPVGLNALSPDSEYSHEIAPLVANSAPLILTDEHHLIA